MVSLEASRISTDTSAWPLVIVTFRGTPRDEDWEAMFAAYDEWYRRREPFHVVNDTFALEGVPNAAQRKLIAEQAREHERMSRKWVVGSATVVRNALIRGALTAITWLAPPAYELTLCGSRAEAIKVAERALARRGLSGKTTAAESGDDAVPSS